jgi:glycosyltransferase involved in cell wall biosynthesis
VVIPTYKRPDLLFRLLTSISRQTLLPDEVIVVDDASGMDKQYNDCITEFETKLLNLRLHRLPVNAGAPHARNVGISLSKSDWIALVDDDDEWLPEKLHQQWEIAKEASPNLGLIYTWTEARGSSTSASYVSDHLVRGDARRHILNTNFIMSASVLVKKQALLKAGLFDEMFPSCQDWDMWTRIFLLDYTCDVVPCILSIYHRHGNESIGLSPNAKLGYRLYISKYFWKFVKHTSPLNVLKKSVLFVRSGYAK